MKKTNYTHSFDNPFWIGTLATKILTKGDFVWRFFDFQSVKAQAHALYKSVLVSFIFENCTILSNITLMSVCSLPLVMLVAVPPVLNILLTGERRGHFTISRRPVGIQPQI